jgi:hypothetical protein
MSNNMIRVDSNNHWICVDSSNHWVRVDSNKICRIGHPCNESREKKTVGQTQRRPPGGVLRGPC